MQGTTAPYVFDHYQQRWVAPYGPARRAIRVTAADIAADSAARARLAAEAQEQAARHAIISAMFASESLAIAA